MRDRLITLILCGLATALATALLAPAGAHAYHDGVTAHPLPPDPNGYYAPWEAELVNEERGAIGLINQARGEAGLAPLRVSLSLTDAADRYAGYLTRSGQFDHSAYGTGTTRAEAAGWRNGKCPCYGVAETLVKTPKAVYAVNAWLASPEHRDILLNPHLNAIGIARADRVWNADFGTCDYGTAQEPYCQMTADEGDASLASPPEPADDPPSSDPAPPDRPTIGLKVKRRRSLVDLDFSLPAGDTALDLLVSQGPRQIRRQLAGVTDARLRLGRGRWLLEATSESTSICRQLRLRSARSNSAARHWIRVRTSPCPSAATPDL